jgi:hypothetical protein
MQSSFHLPLLPDEIQLQIFGELDIASLLSVGLVDKYRHALAEDESIWKKKCYAHFSLRAINRMKSLHEASHWKEIFNFLARSTQEAYQYLLEYYIGIKDAEMTEQEISQHVQFIIAAMIATQLHPLKYAAKEPSVEMILSVSAILSNSQQLKDTYSELKKYIHGFVNASKLHRWNMHKNHFGLSFNNNEWKAAVYTACATTQDYHCKLFAAAATGNTFLLGQLLQEGKLILEDIFNINVYERHIKDLAPFGASYPDLRLVFSSPETSFPSLVDFIDTYDQQDILDAFYEFVLKEIHIEERLHWAIICRQPEQTLRALIAAQENMNANLFFVNRESISKVAYTPLYFAVIFNHTLAIKLLIECGAEVIADPFLPNLTKRLQCEVKIQETLSQWLLDGNASSRFFKKDLENNLRKAQDLDPVYCQMRIREWFKENASQGKEKVMKKFSSLPLVQEILSEKKSDTLMYIQ